MMCQKHKVITEVRGNAISYSQTGCFETGLVRYHEEISAMSRLIKGNNKLTYTVKLYQLTEGSPATQRRSSDISWSTEDRRVIVKETME